MLFIVHSAFCLSKIVGSLTSTLLPIVCTAKVYYFFFYRDVYVKVLDLSTFFMYAVERSIVVNDTGSANKLDEELCACASIAPRIITSVNFSVLILVTVSLLIAGDMLMVYASKIKSCVICFQSLTVATNLEVMKRCIILFRYISNYCDC